MFRVLYPFHRKVQALDVGDFAFTTVSKNGHRVIDFAEISKLVKQCRIGYESDRHCDLIAVLTSGEHITLSNLTEVTSDSIIRKARDVKSSISVESLPVLIAGSSSLLPDVILSDWLSLSLLAIVVTFFVYLITISR